MGSEKRETKQILACCKLLEELRTELNCSKEGLRQTWITWQSFRSGFHNLSSVEWFLFLVISKYYTSLNWEQRINAWKLFLQRENTKNA